MEELFGKLLRAVIPFIIPAVLVVSWMMNHKSGGQSSTSSGAGASNKKQAGSAAPKKSNQLLNKTPVEPAAVEAPSADGVIADLAEKAADGPKTDDPYSI